MKQEDLEFIERLKILIDRERSLTAFAKKVGVRYQKLYKYLSGENFPAYAFFFRLADLGYDVNWLLTGIEAPIRKKPGDIPPVGTKKEYKERLRLLLEEKLPDESQEIIERMYDALIEKEQLRKEERERKRKKA